MKIQIFCSIFLIFNQIAIAFVGPHFLIGEASEATLLIAKEVTDARNASEHYFTEFEDTRSYKDQIIRPHQFQKRIKEEVPSGQAVLIMDARLVRPIVDFAKQSGYWVYLIEDGYQRLGIEANQQAERAFAEFGIKVLLVRKKSTPKKAQSPDRLHIETEKELNQVVLRAEEKASGDLVGMARVYLESNKNEAHLAQIEISQDKQSVGYGREFFDKVVKSFTDRNMTVTLADDTKCEVGQNLYGGPNTLKSFDVEVIFEGGRQNYKLSKMKGMTGKKTYKHVQLTTKSRLGAASPAYDALTNNNANPGSVLELMGYLKTYEKDRQTLSRDTKFLSILDSKLNEAENKSKTPREDGDAHIDPAPYQQLHKALLDLKKLLAH